MQFTQRIHRAIMTAAQLHQGQQRKTDDIPYVMHPYAVALIVSQYTEDEDTIVAALLHDVLEDVASYSPEQMTGDFGQRVTTLVQHVSEPGNTPNMTDAQERATWEDRKRAYLYHISKAPEEALLIVAADKLHNIRSTIDAFRRHGSGIFKKFHAPVERRQWFYNEVIQLLRTRLDTSLVQELEQAFRESKKVLTTTGTKG